MLGFPCWQWIASLFVILLLVGPNRSPASQSAETLRSRNGVEQVELSPTGKWIVAIARTGKLDGVLAQRVGSAEVESLIATESSINWLHWVGPDTLLTSVSTGMSNRVIVYRFSGIGSGVAAEARFIDAPGALVDALPLNDDELLWEYDYDGKNTVYRLTIEELAAFGVKRDRRGRAARPKRDLVTISGSSLGWLVDRSGEPRVAWRRDDSGYTLLVSKKSGGRLRRVYTFEDDDDDRWLKPMALTADESKIIVSAYNGMDTLGLHEFDPETGEIGETIFQRLDVDFTGVLVDPVTHEIVAAVSEPNGEKDYHYFDSYREKFKAGLDPRFPIESTAIYGGTQDRKKFVFFVSSATNPGAYFYRDVSKGISIPIARVGADIDRRLLSDVESFVVESEDGTEVEAYLTIPRDVSGAAPLVVMPHGGPYEVRDRRVYDPLVQYLASWGFAILQPNYRGSSGYGRAFLESGKKEWARGIEDDIDAAVEHAITRPDVDEGRVCIIGGSYGGFSALTSVVRHKDRYRCAISLNGVSDIPLLAETSDYSDSKRVLELYSDHIGDLKTERNLLVDASPAYHADEIDVPVFMIYGTRDRRVDPDHAHRMMLMLELFGKDFDSLEIDGMRHSPGRLEWIIVMRAIRRNLTRHLMPGIEFAADPEIEVDRTVDFDPRLRFER
jgi:dienelactone hydrolase